MNVPITRRALAAEGFPENLDREIEELQLTEELLGLPGIFGPAEGDHGEKYGPDWLDRED